MAECLQGHDGHAADVRVPLREPARRADDAPARPHCRAPRPAEDYHRGEGGWEWDEGGVRRPRVCHSCSECERREREPGTG